MPTKKSKAPKRRTTSPRVRILGPGTPSKRVFPVPPPKRGDSKTGMRFDSSYIPVGQSGSDIDNTRREYLIKLVSDRARRHLRKPKSYVNATLVAIFASRPEDPEGVVMVFDKYRPDGFHGAGPDWEYLNPYGGHLTKDVGVLRTYLREALMQAKREDRDVDFVFILAIKYTNWTTP